MRACDSKLKASLVEAMKLEEARIEEEMKSVPEHVFPESFEQKMEDVLQVQKRKIRWMNIRRHAVAVLVVSLLIGGIMIVGSKDLQASTLSVDILAWLEEFFTTEKDKANREDNGALFEEEQIGYLPEGFEKVGKFESRMRVYYNYENTVGEWIRISVTGDKTFLHVDNEKVGYEVHLNNAGYEYTNVSRDDSGAEMLIWCDSTGVYYTLTGTVSHEELIKIMNGISY